MTLFDNVPGNLPGQRAVVGLSVLAALIALAAVARRSLRVTARPSLQLQLPDLGHRAGAKEHRVLLIVAGNPTGLPRPPRDVGGMGRHRGECVEVAVHQDVSRRRRVERVEPRLVVDRYPFRQTAVLREVELCPANLEHPSVLGLSQTAAPWATTSFAGPS